VAAALVVVKQALTVEMVAVQLLHHLQMVEPQAVAVVLVVFLVANKAI
jgi:hypothetical protein